MMSLLWVLACPEFLVGRVLRKALLILTTQTLYIFHFSAATELCANGMDPKDILIIDGADYIGGRTNVAEFGGYSLNTGASWLMGSCAFCNESFKEEFELNPMFEIAEEMGL
eukprot:245293_1